MIDSRFGAIFLAPRGKNHIESCKLANNAKFENDPDAKDFVVVPLTNEYNLVYTDPHRRQVVDANRLWVIG